MANGSAIRARYAETPPRGFPPTTADITARHNLADVSQLSLNECPFPPSPVVLTAISDAAREVNRYPDPRCRALADAIAAATGVPAGRIVFSNGSDEMLSLLAKVALAAGDAAVMPEPSFPGYAHATMLAEAERITVPLADDGTNDIEGLLGAITPGTRMLFCAPVNNPSGGMLVSGALERLIAGVPDDVLLVMDDAYAEFARHAGGPDVLTLLARRSAPWVAVRTFSKAYALAGLRVGYALCSSEAVAEAVLKVKGTFNVNRIGQAAALAALADTDYRDWILDETARERQRLADGCTALGLVPMPSAGNYLSVRLPITGAAAASALLKRGLFVRGWTEAGYENCLRITIGRSEDMTAVLEGLAELFRAPSEGVEQRV